MYIYKQFGTRKNNNEDNHSIRISLKQQSIPLQ